MTAAPSPILTSLLYTSRAVLPLDEPEMEALLGRSRVLNNAHEVTGILLHIHTGLGRPSYFVQLLEGREDAVEDTFARIQRDELHENVAVLRVDERHSRQFTGWSMLQEDLDAAQLSVLMGQDPSTALVTPARFTRDVIGLDTVVKHFAANSSKVGSIDVTAPSSSRTFP